MWSSLKPCIFKVRESRDRVSQGLAVATKQHFRVWATFFQNDRNTLYITYSTSVENKTKTHSLFDPIDIRDWAAIFCNFGKPLQHHKNRIIYDWTTSLTRSLMRTISFKNKLFLWRLYSLSPLKTKLRIFSFFQSKSYKIFSVFF